MPILKFLWLAIRPVSKLESALGGWDVVNLLLLVAYPTIGGVVNLPDVFKGADLAWFAGIPALLLFIAGLKLQYRLASIEKAYQYALSFDLFDIGPKENTLRFTLKLSNTLGKPLEYKIDTTKTYIEIAGKRSGKWLDTNKSWVIPAHKPDARFLPEVELPHSYPCKGLSHCELEYGPPGKLLFRQIREHGLEIGQDASGDIGISYQAYIEEDKRIK